MRKLAKKFACVFAAALFFINPAAAFGAEAPKLNVDAKAAVIMEPWAKKTLFEQNPDERLPIASVTKVMTILLIYEALAQGKITMDDVVTVSEHAAKMGGSQIYLEPMEKQSVRDLIKSVVIASANDAAVALAEAVAGSEEGFADMMNRKAAELGMKNTSFKNACGLDTEGHFSSARDVAIMSAELMGKYPEAFEYTTVWMDSIIHRTARGEEEFGLTNTNKLIRWYNGTTGLKTGSTSQALYCLSGTAERDGLKLIAVVLGAPNPNTRFQEVMRMLDYGYANYKVVKGAEKGAVLGSVKVFKGGADEVDYIVKDEINAVVEKGGSGDGLEREIIIPSGLKAPVLKGDKAGEVIYRLGGEVVGKSDLTALSDVRRATMPDIMSKLRAIWLR